jgi:hypothetical protein
MNDNEPKVNVESGKDEPMHKPSALWMLVPIVLIAAAAILAR